MFIGKDGIRVKRTRNLLIIRFNDRVALRFKKFRSRTMRTSANKTRQTERYEAQMLEFEDDITPMTHVVAGYLLDRLALNIERLAVTCTLNGEHMWAPIEITAKTQHAKPAPIGQPSPVQTARVRSTRKKDAKEEGNKGSSS